MSLTDLKVAVDVMLVGESFSCRVVEREEDVWRGREEQ